MLVSLRLAMGVGRACGVTDLIDPGCGSYFMDRSDRKSGVYWCSCRSQVDRVGFGKEETSRHVRVVLAAGEGGKMWSD